MRRLLFVPLLFPWTLAAQMQMRMGHEELEYSEVHSIPPTAAWVIQTLDAECICSFIGKGGDGQIKLTKHSSVDGYYRMSMLGWNPAQVFVGAFPLIVEGGSQIIVQCSPGNYATIVEEPYR